MTVQGSKCRVVGCARFDVYICVLTHVWWLLDRGSRLFLLFALAATLVMVENPFGLCN